MHIYFGIWNKIGSTVTSSDERYINISILIIRYLDDIKYVFLWLYVWYICVFVL